MERNALLGGSGDIPYEDGPSLRSMLYDTGYIAWHPQAWPGMIALGFAFASWALSPAVATKAFVLFAF